MRAASQAGLDAAAERWETILTQHGTQGMEFARQIFTVVDTLDESANLRRALTDPARSGDDKATLVRRVFGEHAVDEVLDLICGMVRGRWSADTDLPDALAAIAWTSALASAEAHDRLLQVEKEVFQLSRLLTDSRPLRMALADRELPSERRVALVDSLLTDRVTPETLQLVRRVAATLRGRTVPQALGEIGDLAAARRNRTVATVTAAIPPSEAQIARLSEILQRQLGHKVHLNIDVDPNVLGGMRVQLGNDVVDGTIRARLEEAGRAISG